MGPEREHSHPGSAHQCLRVVMLVWTSMLPAVLAAPRAAYALYAAQAASSEPGLYCAGPDCDLVAPMSTVLHVFTAKCALLCSLLRKGRHHTHSLGVQSWTKRTRKRLGMPCCGQGHVGSHRLCWSGGRSKAKGTGASGRVSRRSWVSLQHLRPG